MRNFFAFLLLVFSQAVVAESYLCIPDKATGFAFQDGEWASIDFKVDHQKYILRERTAEEIEKFKEGVEMTKKLMSEMEVDSNEPIDHLLTSTHVVHQHGADDVPLYFCRYVPVTGSYLCEHGIIKGDFLFSTKSGRFTMSYLRGYWRGKDDEQTPAIYIGRCSKI